MDRVHDTVFSKASAPPAALTLESPWYTDPALFAEETAKIFARSWICAARREQLAEPGAFAVVEIAGESIVLTRDAGGALHAFYNVCRHRGTQLCTEASGTFKGSIQCPYHAWTYGLDGSLLAARIMDGVEGFDRSQYPLREARTAELSGFIFVALEPAQAFDVEFAPLLSRFDAWDPAALRSRRRIAYDAACNWKLVFQNYSECYHCPVIHPQLERLSPSDSGRNDLTSGPFLGGYSELRESTLSVDGTTPRKPLPGLSSQQRARVYYYTIFPSLLLSLHPDYVMAHYVRPLAHNRTEIICEWFFAGDETIFEDAVAFWDLTNRQDWRVSELTQRGVASRAYTPGPYSHAEGLLYAFDRHYLHAMGR